MSMKRYGRVYGESAVRIVLVAVLLAMSVGYVQGATAASSAAVTASSGTAAAGQDQAEKRKPIVCVEAGHQAKANLKTEPIAPGSKTKKAKVAGGTSGVATKKPEYKLTLEVALKLEAALKDDYQVVMVRRTNDVNLSNSERAIVCNNAKADVMVRLHADGSTNKNVKGMTFFYPSPDNAYTKPIAGTSKEIAAAVSKQVISRTGAKLIGVKGRGDLTGFNWTKVPTFLIEMGFMTNRDEDVRMSQPEYQDKIVAGIKAGLDAILK
ncbi:N-acetylmuramoyl-L-alanine amidase [Cohnella soli]|uniref:N-acetylmuramoyl-L-alanine amidase n=1 Tax=Cohnella soli TaxID=425005 RepID=A0ABW0I2C0_9BACL